MEGVMDVIARVWRGEGGLARTYWGWGFLGSIVLGASLSLFPPGSPIALLALAFAIAYLVWVYVGIWRSASQYKGPAVWAALAKFVVSAGLVMVVAGTIVAVVLPARQSGSASPSVMPGGAPASTDKDGKPCTEITEFLGECKRH